MKITLEPTSLIVTVNGVRTRVWQGHTERGTPIHAHVAFIGVDRDADCAELEAALIEVAPPRPDLVTVPLRMLLDD